ncbi:MULTISPECIES: hypothetical protein [Embleya]|jgi:hypothetical protein|uniref:hypothetical protein n=1 Tax=Embleya TaxID=2699295 RepID=UPI00035D3EAF|nr:hypothetical protein [Embleya scabrispora]MYS81929.1 hypothetical protein [Streptomyces sp. SID5474]
MTLDRLVCANCAGLVAEGRCPTCRASRERLQRSGGLNPAMLAAIALLVLVCALLLARVGG